MRFSQIKQSIAMLALTALAACGGRSAGTNAMLPPGAAPRPDTGSILSRIVGVGDSLTAGYQADGFLGQTGVRDPLFPSRQIPPNQENGWWALLYEQASGSSLETAIADMYDAAKGPLPLIKGPGLDNQIVPQNNLRQPFGQFKGADPCKYAGGFNQDGFGFRASARVRIDPTATTVRDFGIPGLTLHEAITIHQPQTSTCLPLPGIPGLLSDVVNEESGTFWPVLRNFTKLGGHLTEVNAAASLHPTLATVWLGANDVLKYMGSGGRFVGGDRTAGQAESDVRATVTTLQRAGAHVVVANLPSIVETGFFQRVGTPTHRDDCRIRTYAYCFIVDVAGLPTNAVQYFAKKYHLETPNGCVPASTSKPCGYLTLPGVIEIIQYYFKYYNYADLDCAVPAPHCKSVAGNGLGMNYITPEFAGRVQALNNVVNQGIDEAATASNVPLVNISEVFHGLASGDPSNKYFHLASSINPGVCCTLGYIHQTQSSYLTASGGILSFDGIHPSNTGYALIAYVFIGVINEAYGTHIPQVDVTAAYNGTRCSNKKYCFKDPYAPH
jgi:lysophospholipase L1-like esterase